MKHIDEIRIEGDNHIYGYDTGYCRDIDSYVVRRQSGYVYDYCNYYRINEDEYQSITGRLKELNSGGMYIEQIVPEFSNRYIGAGHARGYDLAPPINFECKNTPYLYLDGPFLCDGAMFYFHLYWDGHHYAATPRLWDCKKNADRKIIYVGLYRERSDINLIKINYNGKGMGLCYGKEVFDFDGIEDWNKLKDASLNIK